MNDHPLDPTTAASTSRSDASSNDERIDALARAAGSELRRPAPADGLARAQRARRQKQVTRVGGAGVAAVAILAIGAVAIGGRDAGPTVVPATVSTVETPGTTTPGSTPGSTAPDSTTPDSTTADTGTADTAAPDPTPTTSTPTIDDAPDAIWGSAEPFPTVGSQVTTIDPTTGAVTGTPVVDDALTEASRAAQDDLVLQVAAPRTFTDDGLGIGLLRYEITAGDIGYGLAALPSEIPTLADQDPAALPFFDRCQQAELTVDGADGAALPDRARSITVSADRSRLLVVSSDCPDAGTLADGAPASTYELTFQVFDAARPDLPGRTVASGVTPSEFGGAVFSPDARFLSVELLGEYRYFDVDAGTELDRDVVLGAAGCTARGTMWSRFIGPWVGDSTLAVVLDCSDRSELLVLDLAAGGDELRVRFPVEAESFALSADVGRDVVDPLEARFTMCDSTVGSCWIGHGDRALVEVPGTVVLSFLPLGFNVGG